MKETDFITIAINETQKTHDILEVQLSKIKDVVKTTEDECSGSLLKKVEALELSLNYLYFYIEIFSNKLNIKPIDVVKICRDYIQDYNSNKNRKSNFNKRKKIRKKGLNQADSKAVRLRIHKQDQALPYILNDYPLIVQTVIIQILRNATKYSLPGQEIVLSLNISEDNEFELTFTNYGPDKYSEEETDYLIWQKGWRGSSASSLDVTGTGIGLHLVDKIAKSLNFYRGAYNGEQKLTVNGIDYYPFNIWLRFPIVECKTDEKNELFLSDEYIIFYHEIIQAIERYFRKIIDIENWLKSNPDKFAELGLIIKECEFRIRRLEMQLHYIFYIYDQGTLPQMVDDDILSYDFHNFALLIKSLQINNIVVYYDSPKYKSSTVFMANKLYLRHIIEEFIYHIDSFFKDGKNIIIGLSDSDASLTVSTDYDFDFSEIGDFNLSYKNINYDNITVDNFEFLKCTFLKEMFYKTIKASSFRMNKNNIIIYLN